MGQGRPEERLGQASRAYQKTYIKRLISKVVMHDYLILIRQFNDYTMSFTEYGLYTHSPSGLVHV